MQKIGNTLRRGVAMLSGVAMVGALGLVVAPAATAAGTCQVNDGKWSTFTACVNGANAGSYSTIELADDVTAGTDGGLFDPSSYESLTFSSHVTIEGNGHTIYYVHFVVNNGGDLTLKNTAIDDSVSIASDSEIPVYVSNGTFTLGEGSSLDATGGSNGTRAIGIVAGDNAVVNLNSAGQPGTTAAVRSSSASVLTRNDSGSVFSDLIPGQVSNTTINITAGDIVNGHSQDNETYAINSWGADVNVSGSARVQEVYIRDANYTQTGGRVWPNMDNVYGDWITQSSAQYPLSLDGSAQAFVSGGTLTGNYNSDQGQQGKAVLVRSANAKFNVRPDAQIELGGYDESAKNVGAAPAVPGTSVPQGSGFSAPVQNQHLSSFSAQYTDTKLSQLYDNAQLRSFNASEGESGSTSFSFADEVKRGNDSVALDNPEFKAFSDGHKQLDADLSPTHAAQFVYAVWTVSNEDLVAAVDGGQQQMFVYGTPGYVPAYYDWYKGSEQAKGVAPAQANGDDRLFAGWYQDDTLAAVQSDPTAVRYPFGHFVGNNTQNVFVQRSAATANGKFSLRILYGAPKDAMSKYVFKVKFVHGETQKEFNVTTTALYGEATTGAKDTDAHQLLTPAELAQQLGVSVDDAQSFTGGYINNIPGAWADATIEVTPAWVTMDGTSISRGTTKVITVPQTANETEFVPFTDR